MSSPIEQNQSYKNLYKNFTSLSVLQLSNYLFPLILLPFLVRVLGADKYGLIQFAAALNGYFLLLCDYGFGLTGTRLISQNRDDRFKCSEIFSAIITVKIIFYLISLIILVALVVFIQRFSQDWLVYVFSSGLVLGSVLSPVWFFQGVEKMSYLAIINITIRTISTILIFIMIKSQSDYILFITINSSTFILIGLTGLFIAINKFKIQIKLQSREMIFKMIRDGWNIFLSSVWINLYTTSNTFILGLFTNNTIVGYFAAADKIRIAFQGLQSTVSQSVFPFVSKLAKESVNDFLKFNRKLFKFSGISGLVISLIILFFASEITNLILGKNFAYSADILRIISFLPFLISLSNVAGIQTMIPLGYDKSFNKIIAFAAFVHIALLLIFVPDYIAYGVAYTVLLTETIVTFLMLSFLRSKKINLFIK